MSNRLNTISKYINENDKVVDVGCDHAILGELLAERNISSIASDVVPSIIETRKKEEHSPLITFMLSDGLKDIDDSLYDTVVISGMGSITIKDIVVNSTRKFKKLITVSNKDYYYLRNELSKLGYKISLEEVIYEKGKFYNLIIFEPGREVYSYKELLLGVNHQNIENYKKKVRYMYDKYNIILPKVPSSSKKEIRMIKKIIRFLEQEI